jgi:hypothetical protein
MDTVRARGNPALLRDICNNLFHNLADSISYSKKDTEQPEFKNKQIAHSVSNIFEIY